MINAIARPAALSDVDGLVSLAKKAGRGMTTMPHDKAQMSHHVAKSIAAFSRSGEKPATETYALVLEEDGKVIGTSSIFTNLGAQSPFYSYRRSHITTQAPDIDIRAEMDVLYLVNDYHGFTEIGTLFLDPDYRGGGRGRLLSFARFMLMAAHPERFDTDVMADIRGWANEDGDMPFWEAIGQKFFDMSFNEADRRSAHDHRFIADLMPKYPIYVPLLTQKAQDIIGKPHAQSVPAMELLKAQGFRHRNCVDIFDAGPGLDASLQDIDVIAQARRVTASLGRPADGSVKCLIANPKIESFHCVLGSISSQDDTVYLSAQSMRHLQAGEGSQLLISQLKGKRK